MIRRLKLTLGSLIFATCLMSNGFNASASEYTEFVNSLVYLRDLATIDRGLYLDDVNGYTYVKDANGNICYGYSYDTNGNLYYTEEGSTTGLLKSSTNADGISFDENGIYINPSMVEPEKQNILSQKFEAGETLTFKTREELFNFLEYYGVQYRLYDEPDSIYIIKNSDKTYSITLPEDKIYNRQEVLDLIHKTFTPLEGDTQYEKVFNLCQKIRYESTYDLVYKHLDLKTVLNDKKGVCWHYAKIGKVLLEDAGIQTEIMHGTFDNKYHMWLRCLIDGKWCYVDPTATQQNWWDFSNMSYAQFITHYKPQQYIILPDL